MASYIWSLIIAAILFWILSRVIAWVISLLLKRYFDIQVKFGKIGLFNFGNVQILIKRGLSVELDRIWLSSCFFNPDVKKPVVICIQDVRIQADVGGDSPAHSGGRSQGSGRSQQPGGRSQGGGGRRDVSQVLLLAQFLGVRIQNLTVMLLKTMVSDCLVHITAQEIDADLCIENDNCSVSLNLNGVTCKALRSTEEEPSSSQSCLAEISVSLCTELKVSKEDPTKLKILRVFVSKPQMMITEGFLGSLQEITVNRSPSVQPPAPAEVIEPGDTSQALPLQKFSSVQEVGIDFTDLDVKIVRETKQRSLAVALKLFHVGFHNQSRETTPDLTLSVKLEEFYTSSPQHQFAGLKKFDVKVQLLGELVNMTVDIRNGFFHYHHEEVQYWVLVLAQMSQVQATPPVTTRKTKTSSFKQLYGKRIQEKKINVVMEMTDLSSMFSSASCAGFRLAVSRSKLSVFSKPGLKGHGMDSDTDGSWAQSHDMTCELETESVYCCHADKKAANDFQSQKKHYWDQVFSLGIILIKLKKLGRELRLEGMKDNVQVEWSTNTITSLHHLITAVKKMKNQSLPPRSPSPPSPVSPSPASQTPPSGPGLLSQFLITVKFDISNLNMFLCNTYKVCLMLRVDSICIDHRQSLFTLALDGTKLVYLAQQSDHHTLSRSSELINPVAEIKEIRAKMKTAEKELQIYVLKELGLVWTTACHMCLHQALTDFTQLKAILQAKDETTVQTAPKPNKPSNIKLCVNVLVNADTHLTLKLSNQHSVSVVTDNILLTATLPDILVEVQHFDVLFDDNKIVTIRDMEVKTIPPSTLSGARAAVHTLTLPTNKAWNISFTTFEVVFPYKYNFAACFEEVVNFTKWLKLVHHIKKKPFTVDSPLPPDLLIRVKSFCVQLSDDPFEVKLGDNYELLKDEREQNDTRKVLMQKKILELQRTRRIPLDRQEELYTSLAKRSAEVYIQRSQQQYSNSPMRSKLFTWTFEDIEITALADRSYHGKENVVKHMKMVDPDSPFPDEGLEFTTLWCRNVKVCIRSWIVRLRDYSQAMLDVEDVNMWGIFIAAEQAGSKRAKRSCTVEVDEPWGDMTVERSLPPLKFFYDLSCDVSSYTMAYGVCWEPAVALYNLFMDLVNKPSIDPSKALPFWDKIRLLLHGRLTMSIQKMSWQYHASFDPYNTTELMDWTWRQVIVDWTNGKWVLKGDLDVYTRTASKYDDIRLLHLPDVRFCIRLEWLCVGDANDHHSVMPCAPDKVPDYSMGEHDSFRAFRSENLNLDISLDTKRTAAESQDIPSCTCYASTLRFLDKIKQCMFSTTRPVRRGKLFGVTSPRKPQLTRHYRKIKLHVNFHRFEICYKMSFSNQHGGELLADSFVLNMCNKLTLVPIEDGLCHRPRADWSVRYLKCELGTTKLWLCKSRAESEEEMNVSIRNPLEKSFFMSIANVFYQRADISRENESYMAESDVPNQRLQVYDMKGAWTKKNRAVVINLFDSIQKARSLRRNLSSDALKGFKVEENHRRSRSSSCISPSSAFLSDFGPSDTKLQSGHALSMLMRLVEESDSKSVAFTEEPSSDNLEQLRGVLACQTDDVLRKNWHIELHNSQMLLKGQETSGYVIVSAAKAQVLSCDHKPIWKDRQLRSKTTWVSSVECMQYYATVDPGHDFDDENIPWLSRENVEDRFEEDLSGVPEMVGSGHSVGGVVSHVVGPTEQSSASNGIQLQRIISRCKCQLFYVNYGEVEPEKMPQVPLPPAEDEDVMSGEEGVDTFTLLHHDLNMCSNTLQYSMILDIVNNLLLQVEPKAKEASEKLQHMRFKLMLCRVEDQKTPILQLQELVREQNQRLRKLERDLYSVHRDMEEEAQAADELLEESDSLEEEVNLCKEQINNFNEELTIRISCYKESQLQVKAQMKMDKAHHETAVTRVNEVCFKFAQWRLTEKDGQLGVADLALRNFVYTKTNRDDDSWTHQLELGWVKMTNLLPNSIYRDVLVPRDAQKRDTDNRMMTLRIVCSERPPVGGIAVKEHFEVNVVPTQIQLTYQFYQAVMGFFFPDKNIETDDQQDEEVEKSKKKSEKKSKKEKETPVKKPPSFHSDGDIDKMKERAANNNTFVYIKIPEVNLRVSYKGQKDKNIEDVHDFSFVLPTMEYHNCIWTWFDLLMALKNHSKRTLLSQAIKQKLHMRSRAGDDVPLTDVQQEEDKAKMQMLLGAKLLAGQEKPSKKSLFGKSHKS